jgi:hypothetical protein
METKNRDSNGREISFQEARRLRASLNSVMGSVLDISAAIEPTPEIRRAIEDGRDELAREPLSNVTACTLTLRERDECVGRSLRGCDAFLDIIRRLNPDSNFDNGLRSTALMLIETIAAAFRLDQKSVKELGPQPFTASDIKRLGALVGSGKRRL